MNEKDAISKLGGSGEVAKRYGYRQSQVSNWLVRGIPLHVLFDDKKLARALKRAGYRRGE